MTLEEARALQTLATEAMKNDQNIVEIDTQLVNDAAVEVERCLQSIDSQQKRIGELENRLMGGRLQVVLEAARAWLEVRATITEIDMKLLPTERRLMHAVLDCGEL